MGLIDKIQGGIDEGAETVGGAVDGTVDTLEDVRDTGQNVGETYANDGALPAIGQTLDAGVGGTVDTTLDNDVLSIQDAVQSGVVGAYNAAPGGPQRDEEYVLGQIGQATSNASNTVDEAVDGTPLDNPVTDATAWGANALVGVPAKAAFGTVTGIDPGSGEDDYRPSALEAVDLALVGAGSAATSAAARSGRLTNRLRTALRSDDATAVDDASALPGGGGATDDTTAAADEVVEATVRGGDNTSPSAADGTADNALDLFNPTQQRATSPGSRGPIGGANAGDDVVETAVRGGDDAGGAATSTTDDVTATATRTGDDGGSAVDDTVDSLRVGDDGGSAVDDTVDSIRVGDDGAPRWADAAFRGGDDAAPALDDLSPAARGADDAATTAARGADDAATTAARGGDDAADDSSGLFSLGTKTKYGLFGVGTAGIGAAATTAFSSDQVPDNFTATDANGTEYTFVVSGRLRPENSDQFDSGASLYAVSQEQNVLGYWVVFGADGDGNLVLLGPSGNKRTSTLTPGEFENSLPGAPQSEGQS